MLPSWYLSNVKRYKVRDPSRQILSTCAEECILLLFIYDTNLMFGLRSEQIPDRGIW